VGGRRRVYVPACHGSRCTVEKANQNDVIIWKIAVLGMKKPPVGAETILSLAHAGILHSSMPEMPEDGRLIFHILFSHAR
jgi:hypothetical protein